MGIRALGIGGSAIGNETIGGYTSSSVADPTQGGAGGVGITLTINAVSYTANYAQGSLQISCDLGSRTTADFLLRDPTDSVTITVGTTVEVKQDGTTVFAGVVYGVQEEYPSFKVDSSYKEIRVECTDYNQYADRHIVTASYESMTPGAIAADLLTDYLVQDGVSQGTFDASGITVDKIVFNYDTVANALDRLSELVGFTWYIDDTKKLQFRNVSLATSGISITDANIATKDVSRISVSETLEKYRNRQFLKAGKDTTGERIDVLLGDGQQQTFTLALPVAAAPRIFVDDIEVATADIGLREIDTGKKWYWQEGSNQITHDSDETPLTGPYVDSSVVLIPGQELEVRYSGYFEIVVQADDTGQQSARATLEGGSGIYEAVESDERIVDSNFAQDRASAFIRKWARIATHVEIDAYQRLFPICGVTVDISLSKEGLSGDYLIESISASDLGDGSIMRWSAQLLDGEAFGGWPDFFKRLAEQGQKFALGGTQRPNVFRENQDAITISDVLTAAEGTPAVLDDWETDPYTVALVGLAKVANGTRVDATTGALVEDPRGAKVGEPTHV